jgi:CTP:phosphocholine cytidylyltransferase-like protein/thiamine kinase-like enzyme
MFIILNINIFLNKNQSICTINCAEMRKTMTNYIVLLLRNIKSNPSITQRELSQTLHISLGSTNKYVKSALEQNYLTIQEDKYYLSEKGNAFLEQFRVKNAVIIAAGFGSRFVPLTFETPKGLLEVFGERMIERQIKQLHEVGITDITIVVGYLKEKFEYLIDTYQVKLLYNPEYATKNNLATLYHARHLLSNTYILSSDHWIKENIFHLYEPEAWYSSVYMKGETSEWCLDFDKKERITNVHIGGFDSYVMYGPVYFDQNFSKDFLPLLEEYYHRPGTENFYWEHVYIENIKKLPMSIYRQKDGIVYEFENLEELRKFDKKYQNHSENVALEKISEIFSVSESEITKISCLKSGMTNKSFLFYVKDMPYIFRFPGPGTEELINRVQEKACYDAIKHLHLADEILYFDSKTGYKISRFYPDSRNCDPRNLQDVEKCMELLRNFHHSGVSVTHQFCLREKITFYENLCILHNGIHFEDYIKTKKHMLELLDIIEALHPKQVLSHIDSVQSNFLMLSDNTIKLIDWEYSGMCDPLIDLAMFAIYSYYTEEELENLIKIYLKREPSKEEHIRIYSYVALSGFLWALWAEYKTALGEEFGEYTIYMYRYGKIYYKKAKNLL